MEKEEDKEKKKKKSILSLLPPFFVSRLHARRTCRRDFHSRQKKSSPVNQYIVDRRRRFSSRKKKKNFIRKTEKKSPCIPLFAFMSPKRKRKTSDCKNFFFLRSNAKQRRGGRRAEKWRISENHECIPSSRCFLTM